MRQISHWTPRYFHDRYKVARYEEKQPNQPWLTEEANNYLTNWLRSDDVGLEWGSGRSTLWFSRHLKSLTSVESKPEWHERVKQLLNENHISNVRLLLLETLEGELSDDDSNPYVNISEEFQKESLDFILVDGMCRSSCALRAIMLLKPGGILVVDNINWFLPSNSRSPASRTSATGPLSPRWELFQSKVKPWRHYWTSNGVTDTAIWEKPLP